MQEKWDLLESSVLSAAQDTIPPSSTKTADLFLESESMIRLALEKWNGMYGYNFRAG